MCYQLPNNCLFFFFFLSPSICENLSPGALLYQAPAAAVILDMAGSRYRKTARAHSAQKNLEIPLIYPRLWNQKPVAKKKKQKQKKKPTKNRKGRGVLAGGGRREQTTVSGLCVGGRRRVPAIPCSRVAGRCSTRPCEPSRGALGRQEQRSRPCCRHPPLPAEKTPSHLPRDGHF